MATRIGLEPTTPSVTGWCSNQLSYRAMIAQVRGCSPPERALLYPKNDFLSSRNLQKPQKTFQEKRKSRPQAENGQNKTSGTIAPDVCGRGSKSRTHGTVLETAALPTELYPCIDKQRNYYILKYGLCQYFLPNFLGKIQKIFDLQCYFSLTRIAGCDKIKISIFWRCI